MATKPSVELVQKEIAELKRLAPIIRQRTAFGDSNRAKIDAEIRVLEKNMTQDQIEEHWDGDSESERALFWSAFEAREWLDGDSEEETLSESWLPLVVKE
jgi:hypothetical protein